MLVLSEWRQPHRRPGNGEQRLFQAPRASEQEGQLRLQYRKPVEGLQERHLRQFRVDEMLQMPVGLSSRRHPDGRHQRRLLQARLRCPLQGDQEKITDHDEMPERSVLRSDRQRQLLVLPQRLQPDRLFGEGRQGVLEGDPGDVQHGTQDQVFEARRAGLRALRKQELFRSDRFRHLLVLPVVQPRPHALRGDERQGLRVEQLRQGERPAVLCVGTHPVPATVG